MIDRYHITFTEDGYAWIVGDEWFWAEWHVRDRSCGGCDGSEYMVNSLTVPPGMIGQPCTADCVGGRHTLDIEVVNMGTPYRPAEPHYRTYRVSVVLGMVLPITEGLRCSERVAHVCRNEPWSHTGWLYHDALTDERHIETEFPVVMPPAAARLLDEGKKPWAVKVKVATTR